ncbi:PREDICTED: thioredoxin-like protein 1 [Amphimedon queenslandica]|uniref:PITH domain-containing protein n=1 Tax=Amphimedon queenslandica TaxID=400682 RepID=A0A1X7VE74_AMPQE|nr:PREDICTED: thioredoxin-like protein 1 [Amphimedon queenslandica]|eukprot:XP_003384467.1 PREDICTED: thioredoxin-like protein 1 [Amphimedon queenslandica]
MAAPSEVKLISVEKELHNELALSGDQLVVIDFFATWCDPCKIIEPFLDSCSIKYKGRAKFIKIDVDKSTRVAVRYNIQSMPTVCFIKNSVKLDQVVGADIKAIEAGILKHIKNSDSSSASGPVSGQVNINSIIDISGSECLNESDDNTFQNSLESNKDIYLESDCDEQLILSLKFTQPVKLRSLQVTAPKDGRAPKTIKLFINQTYTLDFDSAEGNTPVQTLNLTEEDISDDKPLPLMYLKFQNVQQLTIFVVNNQGDQETTVINYIGLFGSLLDSTNMKDFKRVAGDKGERH